jgi:hypothetical protein
MSYRSGLRGIYIHTQPGNVYFVSGPTHLLALCNSLLSSFSRLNGEVEVRAYLLGQIEYVVTSESVRLDVSN